MRDSLHTHTGTLKTENLSDKTLILTPILDSNLHQIVFYMILIQMNGNSILYSNVKGYFMSLKN